MTLSGQRTVGLEEGRQWALAQGFHFLETSARAPAAPGGSMQDALELLVQGFWQGHGHRVVVL